VCAYRSLRKFRRRRGKARANPQAVVLAQGQCSSRAGLKVVLLSVLFFVVTFSPYVQALDDTRNLPLRFRSVNTKNDSGKDSCGALGQTFVCARLISSVYNLRGARTQFTTLQAISKSYLAKPK